VGAGGEFVSNSKCHPSSAIDFGVSLVAVKFGKADWFCCVGFSDCDNRYFVLCEKVL
jgi:hypothetical protein